MARKRSYSQTIAQRAANSQQGKNAAVVVSFKKPNGAYGTFEGVIDNSFTHQFYRKIDEDKLAGVSIDRSYLSELASSFGKAQPRGSRKDRLKTREQSPSRFHFGL